MLFFKINPSYSRMLRCWWCTLFSLAFLFFVTPSMTEAQMSYFEEQRKRCSQESMKDDVRCLEILANLARIDSGEDEKGLKKAEQLYKKALSIKPNDITVLDNLARMYAQHKRYQEALDLYERIIAIQPQIPGIGMYGCMLKERLKFPRAEYLGCYKMVVRGYRKHNKTTGLNYVYAMIMADEPGADRLKHIYIDSLELGSWRREMKERSLRNADRKKLLDSIIP